MEGHDHGEVERHLSVVVGDQPPASAVDGARVELRDEADTLLAEQAAERARGHRLGEGTVERRHVGELDVLADATVAEVGVGEEAELERRHRALDGPRSGETLGLLGGEEGATGGDEHVVAQDAAVIEVHLSILDGDVVDGRSAELDPASQLGPTGAHQPIGSLRPERHEQQTRLVDVTIVLIDDDQFELVVGEAPA